MNSYESQLGKLQKILDKEFPHLSGKELAIFSKCGNSPTIKGSFYVERGGANSPKCTKFDLRVGDTTLAWFIITQLPGCCGIGVVQKLRIDRSMSKKFKKEVIKLIFIVAKLCNFSSVLATTVSHNTGITKLIRRAGGRKINLTYNLSSYNYLNIWHKDIHEYDRARYSAAFSNFFTFFRNLVKFKL